MMKQRLFPILVFIWLVACKFKQSPPNFEILEASKTGLHFNNKLTPTRSFNMFNYMYFYNGSGVGVGDLNNDGFVDLFFSSNQASCQLYLNKGSLQFEEVTAQTGIQNDGGWSTGVSIVDINQDGMLDIYVCRVGNFENLHSRNLLLVCKEIKNGIPKYEEQAEAFGLAFSGFSTQAAFFDFDVDGDLDCYLMNHSVHHNGTFGPRANFLNTFHALSGDQFFENKNGRFVNITHQSGINSSSIGYGLGICVSDINLDGWPDLYIGNDFHENDYLYINQKNGTFSEELTQRISHTSQFSMGVDIADVNNDLLPEIISLDMLPGDPYILRRSLGEDEYETFKMKLGYGYNHQYAKNALQFNRGNGQFSEVALYAGVAATDWSWSALWLDFDNNGWKDLFVSNGIPKRLNDIDYVNFVSNETIQAKISENKLEDRDLAVINQFPQIKLPNKLYANKQNLQFEDMAKTIANDQPTFSNGAAYADFDNDGDLDIVVSNIDAEALLYENKHHTGGSIQVIFKGEPTNRNAVGAKIIWYDPSGEMRFFEAFPVRGFQSSMQIPLHIGYGSTLPDSLLCIWPNNRYQKLHIDSNTQFITVNYEPELPFFDYSRLQKNTPDSLKWRDITHELNIDFEHHENRFNEFNREQLLPFMLSTEGPATAVGDINGDGLDDIFLGSSKLGKPQVYTQTATGRFERSLQPSLDADSTFEEVDALFVDIEKDGDLDLVLASGGNEFYGNSPFQQPRIFSNDGLGHFTKLADAIPPIFGTGSCVTVNDFNADGYPDLFFANRSLVWEYGVPPQQFLLQNNGTGRFLDVTKKLAPDLEYAGMITDACWLDCNNDQIKDLVVASEWQGIYAFINKPGVWKKQTLTPDHGFWRMCRAFDADADGDMDLMVGNMGQNCRLVTGQKNPVKMYVGDFDNNQRKEQLITYLVQGQEIPFASKMELEKQMPYFKKKYLYAEDFAKANIKDIVPQTKAFTYEANYFQNAVLVNQGNGSFKLEPLPWQAQLATYRTFAPVKSKIPTVLLGGNFYEQSMHMGRSDADFGTLLSLDHGHWQATTIPGLPITGEIRKITPLSVGKRSCFLITRNNDKAMVIEPPKVGDYLKKVKK